MENAEWSSRRFVHFLSECLSFVWPAFEATGTYFEAPSQLYLCVDSLGSLLCVFACSTESQRRQREAKAVGEGVEEDQCLSPEEVQGEC